MLKFENTFLYKNAMCGVIYDKNQHFTNQTVKKFKSKLNLTTTLIFNFTK